MRHPNHPALGYDGRYILPERETPTPEHAAKCIAFAQEFFSLQRLPINFPSPSVAERAALNSLQRVRMLSRQRMPNASYASFLQAWARNAANDVRFARARLLAEAAR